MGEFDPSMSPVSTSTSQTVRRTRSFSPTVSCDSFARARSFSWKPSKAPSTNSFQSLESPTSAAVIVPLSAASWRRERPWQRQPQSRWPLPAHAPRSGQVLAPDIQRFFWRSDDLVLIWSR